MALVFLHHFEVKPDIIIMREGPALSALKLLILNNLCIFSKDLIEIIEVFAVQDLAVEREVNGDVEMRCIRSGAITRSHPIWWGRHKYKCDLDLSPYKGKPIIRDFRSRGKGRAGDVASALKRLKGRKPCHKKNL
ncbi:MAG: hypothetical protein PVH84_10385 [Candidatus Aminicenantes bacterium]|jgi:hypothetical protein